MAAPGDDGPKTRIIGGEDATEAYAFMASMQTREASDHNCGASLISSEWILTAAHCVEGDDPADWQFRIGSNTYNDGGHAGRRVGDPTAGLGPAVPDTRLWRGAGRPAAAGHHGAAGLGL